MNILICDANESDAKNVETILEYSYGSKMKTTIFHKADDAISYIRSGADVDVCFLETVTPEMDGIELARNLREDGYKGEIASLTESKRYGSEAYEVKAIDDLRKPVMPSILIIDDNEEILSANKAYLTAQGFHVTCADTGIKAIACLSEAQYDCIVLDVLLPDLDGFFICKAARTLTKAPIIFLSCMDDTDDKIKGLAAGGDDYMTKPYSMNELSARISALLRRSEINMPTYGDGFYVDRRNRMIQTEEKSVFLSQKEFELFLLLYGNPGIVFSKEKIFEKIWNGSSDISTVAVHIMRLRKKIAFAKNDVGQIENSYGTGYYFLPSDRRSPSEVEERT